MVRSIYIIVGCFGATENGGRDYERPPFLCGNRYTFSLLHLHAIEAAPR